VNLLRESFFPTPPPADLSDLEELSYETPLDLPPITQREIEAAIQRTAPKKAPGPDEIPNQVLQLTAPMLILILEPLFNTYLDLGYCPQHFKQSITVVLWKPGKENSTEVKSY
jgi:hypothetical protein